MALHAAAVLALSWLPRPPPPTPEPTIELVMLPDAEPAEAPPPAPAPPEPAPPPVPVAPPPDSVAAPLAPAPPAVRRPIRPRPVVPLPQRAGPLQAAAASLPVPASVPASVPVPVPAVGPRPSPELLAAYRSALVEHLQGFRRYPAMARLRHQEGEVMVRFTLDRAGRLVDLAVERSSGVAALDSESLAMLHRAEPLPPIPAGMAEGHLAFVFPVRFRLE